MAGVQKAIHIVDIVLTEALARQNVQQSLDDGVRHAFVQPRLGFVTKIDRQVLIGLFDDPLDAELGWIQMNRRISFEDKLAG